MNPQNNPLEIQLDAIIKEIDCALKLLGIHKPSNAKKMTQIKYKLTILYEEYYNYYRNKRLKDELIESGYSEYPYKRIDKKGIA